MKRELGYFFAALRFFTRLPVPAWVGHSQEQLDHAARYFPLIGVIVGAIGAAVTLAALKVLPSSVAILLGMAATLLATGAFHEDGLADAADGFGGGWDKAQVMAIMKDSRIGSYAAIALVIVLSAKFHALQALPWETLGAALVAGHAGSRLASTALLAFLDYVREDDSAKSKPLAQRIGSGELAFAGACGLAPFVLLPAEGAALAIVLAALATFVAGRYFARRIGGYTGDCLGAAQQVSELAIYIGLLCAFT